jgi:hypothetical protein
MNISTNSSGVCFMKLFSVGYFSLHSTFSYFVWWTHEALRSEGMQVTFEKKKSSYFIYNSKYTRRKINIFCTKTDQGLVCPCVKYKYSVLNIFEVIHKIWTRTFFYFQMSLASFCFSVLHMFCRAQRSKSEKNLNTLGHFCCMKFLIGNVFSRMSTS